MAADKVTVAVAGNPNSGKSTLFNRLTGLNQRTGNWPGVTVERKEGHYEYRGKTFHLVDLPGTYALGATSLDERIARDFLVRDDPDLVLVVVDSTNLERNLYLVLQLLELGARLILALNMTDQAKRKGIDIDSDALERILGVRAVKTVARTGEGIDELKQALFEESQSPPKRSAEIVWHDSELRGALEHLKEVVSGASWEYPSDFVALKLLEGDPEMLAEARIKGLMDGVAKAVSEFERKVGVESEIYLADRRYGYAKGVVNEVTSRKRTAEARKTFSDKLDSVLTNRYIGIPIFILVLWATFQLVFTLGGPLADLIDSGFGWLADAVRSALGEGSWLASLLADGIIAGVGSVLVFVPNIFLLFLAFAVLEDSGYMARAAFLADKFMHSLGLHGKSIIPMILGFGCNVPAVMATRTLESQRDRLLTILVLPLMSCAARLPIYILFAGAFFAGYRGLVVTALYLFGVVMAILVALVLRKTLFKGEPSLLVMEMPPYRLPRARDVFYQAYLRSLIFVRKAGTIIFAAVVLVWLLGSLPVGVEYASEGSIIGRIGKAIAPIFSPAGFGFWQAAVALMFGLIAKEVVVGTLGTLYNAAEEGLSAVLPQFFSPASAMAFMIMSLLYIPCVATIAIIKREAGWRWALFTTGYTLVLGWIMAVITYQIFRFVWV